MLNAARAPHDKGIVSADSQHTSLTSTTLKTRPHTQNSTTLSKLDHTLKTPPLSHLEKAPPSHAAGILARMSSATYPLSCSGSMFTMISGVLASIAFLTVSAVSSGCSPSKSTKHPSASLRT